MEWNIVTGFIPGVKPLSKGQVVDSLIKQLQAVSPTREHCSALRSSVSLLNKVCLCVRERREEVRQLYLEKCA